MYKLIVTGGKAELLHNGVQIWSSDNEPDGGELSDIFGEVIDGDDAEDLIDWLCYKNVLPETSEVEIESDDESEEMEPEDED